MLISPSAHISKVEQCELGAALDVIKLKYSPHPCKHNDIKEFNKELLPTAIYNFLTNWLFFVVTLYIFLFKNNRDNSGWFYCIFLAVSLFHYISFF